MSGPYSIWQNPNPSRVDVFEGITREQFEKALAEFAIELREKQKPLPTWAEEVLWKERWNLYL